MYYIVDIQGFQYKDSDFICKEIAIFKHSSLSASASSSEISHRIVQLPIPQTWFNQHDVITKHLEWTTNNVHGLSWNNGCAHLGFKDGGNKKTGAVIALSGFKIFP